MTPTQNPAIGRTIRAGSVTTNYHDMGEGVPVLMLHGSGVGVSAYANWNDTLPFFARSFRAVAMDVAGFGYSDAAEDATYGLDLWVRHVVDFLDVMGFDKVHLLGNSFGGALALAVTIRHPDRVRRAALMGSVGLRFEMPKSFNAGVGFDGKRDQMRSLLENFTVEPSSITEEMIDLRYNTSIRPGYDEVFKKLFPGPREQKMNALLSSENDIARIRNDVLVLHGREDRVIPVETSVRLSSLIPRSELHVFSNCGHWSHRDKAERFNGVVSEFFNAPGANA
ncbi:2-hydroxy-6-oxo-2,4-heptadienoate hydrolase [Mesorhizobium sp. SOD10]|nr:2-hydroxy-6-oxo-2,4-heptadienoate hydrolase [Mesorhizobium sp. SOD10]